MANQSITSIAVNAFAVAKRIQVAMVIVHSVISNTQKGVMK